MPKAKASTTPAVAPAPALLLNEQQELVELCNRLKFSGLADALRMQCSQPQIYGQMSFEARLKRALEQELQRQNDRRFAALYRSSRLQRRLYLRRFNASPERGLMPEHLALLAECNYIRTGTNLIITGPTGTGKTALATAAAIQAMEMGYRAVFYRAHELGVELSASDDVAFNTWLKRMRQVRLLVIDDYGGCRFTDLVVTRLVELADARYDCGATIITSQLQRHALPEVIDEGPVREAIADRLFRDCDREISLCGSTWRGKPGEFRGLEAGEHV